MGNLKSTYFCIVLALIINAMAYGADISRTSYLRPPLAFSSINRDKEPVDHGPVSGRKPSVAPDALPRYIQNRLEELTKEYSNVRETLVQLVSQIHSLEQSAEAGIVLDIKKLDMDINARILELETRISRCAINIFRLSGNINVLKYFLKQQRVGRDGKALIEAMRQKGWARVKLRKVQQKALAHVTGLFKGKNLPEFNADEVLFIPRDSFLCKVFNFKPSNSGLTAAISYCHGTKNQRVILIADDIGTFVGNVATLAHENFHKRFQRGRYFMAQKRPFLSWLYRFLEEGMTERLSRHLLKSHGHKLTFLHTFYRQKVLFLERLFDKHGAAAERAVFRFLEKGDSSALEKMWGSNAWEKILKIASIINNENAYDALADFCDTLIEHWMREGEKEFVLDIGVALLDDFAETKIIKGISQNDIDGIKMEVMNHLLIITIQDVRDSGPSAMLKKNVLGTYIKNIETLLKERGVPVTPEAVSDCMVWDFGRYSTCQPSRNLTAITTSL